MSEALKILLLILKILGISLLAVIIFLLIVILLVLLWPIKYNIKFDYKDKDYQIYAKASFMSFVRFIFTKNDDMVISLKIFFWELYGPKKEKRDLLKQEKEKKKEIKAGEKEEKERTKRSIKSTNNDLNKQNSGNSECSSVSSDLNSEFPVIEKTTVELSPTADEQTIAAAEDNIQNSKISSDDILIEEIFTEPDREEKSSGTTSDSTGSSEEKQSDKEAQASSDNKSNQNDNKKAKSKNASHKNSFYGKIKRKIEVIRSEEFKKCFNRVIKKVIRLIKLIVPRKWNINATVGFDDPAKTGKILAISGFLYGLFPGHIRVIGDFEHEVIDVHASAKGHINLTKILIILAQLYFDKKLKNIINKLKEA